MWTQIKSFFNTKNTIAKVVDLKKVDEDLQIIEKSLDLLAEEFTLKNENRKSVISDTSVSDSIKETIENKFTEFVKAYSKDLASQTKERRDLLGRKNHLLTDSQVEGYIDSKNQLKKAFLDGKISKDIFLKIMADEKTVYEVAPYIIEKSTEAQKKKVDKVMSEFDTGDLKSGSGDKVTTMDQAIAIALSEAGIKKSEASDHIAPVTLNAIAEKHKVDVKSMQDQLRQGMKVEMEHTESKEEARKIALTHLQEVHDYYSRMKDMKEDHADDMKDKEKEHKEEKKEEHKEGEEEHKEDKKKDEKEHVEKADYYLPNDPSTVDGDQKEEDKDFQKEKDKTDHMAKAFEYLELAKNEGEIDEFEYASWIEKAKAGTYADNAANRRLGRAGQKYGKEDDDDDKKSTHQKVGDDKESSRFKDEGRSSGSGGKEKEDKEEKKSKKAEVVKLKPPNPKKDSEKKSPDKSNESKKPGVPKVNCLDQNDGKTKELLEQAKKTSKQNLEAAINQSEDSTLRCIAQQELERRKSMENIVNEPKGA